MKDNIETSSQTKKKEGKNSFYIDYWSTKKDLEKNEERKGRKKRETRKREKKKGEKEEDKGIWEKIIIVRKCNLTLSSHM